MIQVPTTIFQQVVMVGPQYKDHRGGMGAVLASYAEEIEEFQFLATFDGRCSMIANIGVFILSLFRLVRKLAWDRKITIVHIHGASGGSFIRKYLIFLIAKYLFRKKVIYHLHGAKFHLFYKNSNFISRYLVKHLAESVDVFICLSRYWQTYLSSEFIIKRLVIVNNPVPVPKKALNRCKDGENNRLNMLFLGRIGDRKGVFDLLAVIKEYKHQWEGRIKLKIGGDGEVDRLLRYIETQNLTCIVEYVGWTDGEKKNKLLDECDALILPSYNEGLPISILEAMSWGKAIISTSVGGIPEIVSHNKNGLLLTPGERDMLAASINKFIAEPGLVGKMGKASLDKVRPYLIGHVLNQLETIYKQSN